MRFTGIGSSLAAPFRWLGKRGAKSLKGIGNGLVASLRWIARWTAKGLRSLKSARVLFVDCRFGRGFRGRNTDIANLVVRQCRRCPRDIFCRFL